MPIPYKRCKSDATFSANLPFFHRTFDTTKVNKKSKLNNLLNSGQGRGEKAYPLFNKMLLILIASSF
jgi:hypothetical protein